MYLSFVINLMGELVGYKDAKVMFLSDKMFN